MKIRFLNRFGNSCGLVQALRPGNKTHFKRSRRPQCAKRTNTFWKRSRLQNYICAQKMSNGREGEQVCSLGFIVFIHPQKSNFKGASELAKNCSAVSSTHVRVLKKSNHTAISSRVSESLLIKLHTQSLSLVSFSSILVRDVQVRL